ncbi:hypothetical protein MHBO_004440, partial [Bonamia ostreae]
MVSQQDKISFSSSTDPHIFEESVGKKKIRFLVTQTPTAGNKKDYLKLFKQNNVSFIVRTCSPFYEKSYFVEAGFQFQDLVFSDDAFPSNSIISRWLKIVDIAMKAKSGSPIAVHCVAGHGRSFLLVF